MNHSQKRTIQKLTGDKILLAGSQNRYAKSVGISPAQMTNLMTDKWHHLSPEMWRKLADAAGFKDRVWEIVQTRSFKDLTAIYSDARINGSTYGITGGAGCGKTLASQWYKDHHANVFALACAEYWNKKSFLSELYKAMGGSPQGNTVYELMDAVETEVLRRGDGCLIILDEADKLKDEVLYFFITLYNRLHSKCGIVLQSTDFMERRVLKGLRLGRRGYAEIFSRMGRRFVQLSEPNTSDITMVCMANKIMGSDIDDVIKKSDSDLRRVERLIHAKITKKMEVSDAA